MRPAHAFGNPPLEYGVGGFMGLDHDILPHLTHRPEDSSGTDTSARERTRELLRRECGPVPPFPWPRFRPVTSG